MKKKSTFHFSLFARASSRGFSLVELLVAATLFTFVVMGVSQLFAQALDIQRRATGYQKIQENALFVLESIAREVRVSAIQGVSGCSDTLTIVHPVNGDVTYVYDRSSGTGVVTRESSVKGGGAEPITSHDVDVTLLSFCITGGGVDGQQARVTVPIALQAVSGRASARVSVSLQTTVVSRDLVEELTN
jgi:prepilin-type N-terminal cleavage/methylation domain-containing protein